MKRILCTLSTIAISQAVLAQQTYHVPSENTGALANAFSAAQCGDTVTIEGGHFDVCALGLQVRQGVEVIGGYGGEGATVLFGQDTCRILVWLPDELCENGVTTISNVVFSHGRLDETDSLGGGGAAVLVDGSDAAPLSKVQFVGCTFSNNQSFAGGGAVQALSVDLVVVNCSFTSNRTDNRIGGYTTSAPSEGGAITLEVSSGAAPSARLSAHGCSFQSNAAIFGGALCLSACAESATLYAELNECVFTANDAKAPNNESGFDWGSGGAVATRCSVILRINDCSFNGNRAGNSGGAMYKHELGGLQIRRSAFLGNQAAAGIGGAVAWGVAGGGDAIVNCSFEGNRAMAQYPGGSGGALGMFNPTQTEGPYVIQVVNCLFAHNSAGSDGTGELQIARGNGGAISVIGGVHAYISQCTIASNVVFPGEGEPPQPGRAPAIFAEAVGNLWPEVTITNTILFGPDQFLASHVCFVDPLTGECATCAYSNQCQCTACIFVGDHNCIGGVVNEVVVGCHPAFVDIGGDFSLSADSDCIDSGDNALVSMDVLDLDDDLDQQERHPYDLLGRQRVMPRRFVRDPFTTTPPCLIGAFNIVDIGAFEYSTEPFCWADWDGNGIVETADIYAYLNDYFASDPCADLDLVNGVDPSDIFVFLSHWFAGC